MSDETANLTAPDFSSRYEAEQERLRGDGFDPTPIYFGGGAFMGAIGGVTKGRMRLHCFCVVPIADLTDGTTTTGRHADTHA